MWTEKSPTHSNGRKVERLREAIPIEACGLGREGVKALKIAGRVPADSLPV